MNPLKSRLDAIASNRAKQFARKVDSIRTTSKVEAPNVRVDITAPTVCEDRDGNVSVERKPLHAAGVVKHVEGKSLGTIATPSSYTRWLRAGQPAHSIYNPVAWKAERYVNGIALPTGGKPVEPRPERHTLDCVCKPCVEYRLWVSSRTAQTPNQDFAPVKPLTPAKDWMVDLLTGMKLGRAVLAIQPEAKAEPIPVLPVPEGKPLRPPVRVAAV